MKSIRIPFNKAYQTGFELKYIQQAVQENHISGDGNFTQKCQSWLEEHLNVPKALLTTSCTHALEMAAFLLNIQPGDEVILSAFTFVSTANAFAIRGARPIFVDIRPDTLNLDENQLDHLVSPRTRAIIAMHYAGIGCEMSTILEIAQRHQIAVIEDNAHGLFGKYQDKYLGTFGSLATQSFHETKNISCGEGGALLINDLKFIERAEILREKGTDRSRFFRGQVDKYTWVDFGSSYLPSDILAAFLFAQLEAYQEIQFKRKTIWETYFREFGNWARENDIRLPFVPENCQQPYHLFYLLLPDLASRQALIEHLKQREIYAVFHYIPLNLSHMGRTFGGRPGSCPISENISDRLVRMPFYTGLIPAEQNEVIEAVYQFRV